MSLSNEDMELFKLIDLATNGNTNAKWEIILKFNDLIVNTSTINRQYNEDCHYYVETAVFNSIEKFTTLRKIKKFKKF